VKYFIISILIGFPLAEGAVLYHLATGPQGHGGWVFAWLVFAAIAGVVLIKQARFSLISRLASAVSQGQFSLSAFIDSFRTVLAGLLLIFPGIISDVMALVLLMIPMREPALEHSPRQQPYARADSRSRATAAASGGVIEGEFKRE
jgi:UPF0716 protein FxsA